MSPIFQSPRHQYQLLQILNTCSSSEHHWLLSVQICTILPGHADLKNHLIHLDPPWSVTNLNDIQIFNTALLSVVPHFTSLHFSILTLLEFKGPEPQSILRSLNQPLYSKSLPVLPMLFLPKLSS